MPSAPIYRDLALRTLREHGPMSKAALIELLGPLGKAAAGAIATARHERPGEFFRIVRYERQRGRAGREIPIYSHAGGTDAPRPDLSGREHVRARQARYYQANRTLVLERFRARRGKPINPWGGLMPPERRTALQERTT